MPKETFFNLEEKKKQRILDAAKKEFTHNELLKSRVSNIIKDANIPRGSFYQYFEDLNDLYYYVIDGVFNDMFQTGIERTADTDDLFEFTLLTFNDDFNRYREDKRKRFMMNIMRSISTNDEYSQLQKKRHEVYITSILSELDLSNIRIKKHKELIKIYHLLQDLKRNVIQRSMFEKISKEEAVEELKWQLDLVKHGILEDHK
jgi:AcrR family transcriptional regulator